MADGGILVTELKKRRGPAVVLQGSCKLNIGCIHEELEALSFLFVGEESARSKLGDTGDSASSMAAELLAS